jgi:hypothetical protein
MTLKGPFFADAATNHSFTFRCEGLTAPSNEIMVLCDVRLYSLIGTNVSQEPAASIFRTEGCKE